MMEKPGPTLHRHLLSNLVRCQIQHSSSLFRAPARVVCPPPPRQFQIQPGLPFSSCFPPILDRSFQHCALPTPMSTTSLWYKQHLLCTLVYIQSIFYAISQRHSNLPMSLLCHWSLSSKESTCNVGELGSIPGSGRSPRERNGNLLMYSCLENSTDRSDWWATWFMGSQRVGQD